MYTMLWDPGGCTRIGGMRRGSSKRSRPDREPTSTRRWSRPSFPASTRYATSRNAILIISSSHARRGSLRASRTSMRKNNKKEKGPGGFSARPFKALKGFVPQAPPAAAPAPPKRGPKGDKDDADLFLEAMSGAKRIDDPAEHESEHRSRGPVRTPDA